MTKYFRSTDPQAGFEEKTWRPELRAGRHVINPQHHLEITSNTYLLANLMSVAAAAGMAPYIKVDKRPTGYAVATIAREPVNSMHLELWRELLATLEALEADPAVRGVVWVSGLKRDVFTAGNDLKVVLLLHALCFRDVLVHRTC